MGTRSVVAKAVGDSWEGRYVHWDGYPTGVGLSLVSNQMNIGTDAIITKLVDDERVGWSTIAGKDLRLDPTWYQPGESGPAPESYTARGETNEQTWTPDDLPDISIEWLYVMSEAGVWVVPQHDPRSAKLIEWGDRDGMKGME